ncbi:hypothetical protein BW716_33010 [[Flexibacter] sp. ATCC 35208]|nr:hypothetical protein BW716_33010 [[Flexibacter] sp. ATCC 35208]
MRLSKYYQQATLYPFLITLVITSIFTILENKNYKSEWLTADAVIMMTILYIFFYCLFLSVLCLTIFLCKFEIVRNNRLLTVLSWFLLPLSITILLVIKELSDYPDSGFSSADSDLLYIVFGNVPFIIGLTRAFILYRKAMQLS